MSRSLPGRVVTPHSTPALRSHIPVVVPSGVEVTVGVSLWCFIENSDGSMSRIPTSRVERFAKGELALEPSSIPGEVRMVQVIVHLDRRLVVGVGPISCPRHRTTARGLLDPNHMRDAMRGAMAMLDLTPYQEGVVNLRPKIAKRDYHAEHSWQPSEAQLQAVANAINGVARHPPVVVVAADGLKPA